MIKHKTVCGLKDLGVSDTFKDAFVLMYKWVIENQVNYQILETTCWIEKDGDVMDFYSARDLACEIGLLSEGKLVS